MTGTISIFKKADTTIKYTFPSSVDLNGDSFYFTAKLKNGGPEDDSDAIISIDGTVSTSTNILEVPISDVDSNVRPGEYQADLKRVTSGGDIKPTNPFTLIVKQTVGQRSS